MEHSRDIPPQPCRATCDCGFKSFHAASRFCPECGKILIPIIKVLARPVKAAGVPLPRYIEYMLQRYYRKIEQNKLQATCSSVLENLNSQLDLMSEDLRVWLNSFENSCSEPKVSIIEGDTLLTTSSKPGDGRASYSSFNLDLNADTASIIAAFCTLAGAAIADKCDIIIADEPQTNKLDGEFLPPENENRDEPPSGTTDVSLRLGGVVFIRRNSSNENSERHPCSLIPIRDRRTYRNALRLRDNSVGMQVSL